MLLFYRYKTVRSPKGSSLPIIIVCTSAAEADNVVRLHAMVEDVRDIVGLRARVLAFTKAAERLGGTLGGERTRWYAVWKIDSPGMTIDRTIYAVYEYVCCSPYRFVIQY